MATHSGRRYKTNEVTHTGEAHEAIPGLHHDIVVTYVLSCANMGPGDIARLSSVSRALCDAVKATGRLRAHEEFQYFYQKLADLTYVHATTPRDMHRGYQDLTAIVRKFGKPDLFVTVTCNPEWSEMAAALLESNTPADRPEIVAHVFKLRLDSLVKEVEVDRIFGETVACRPPVESQKRGLQHAHIFIFLKKKINTQVVDTQDVVDDFVCAEGLLG